MVVSCFREKVSTDGQLRIHSFHYCRIISCIQSTRTSRRMLAMLVIAAVATVPIAIDGFTQMLTDYESNAMMRLLTGTPFGILIGAFMSASFSARPAFFQLDPAKVQLPSGSRFSMKAEEE